MMKVNITDLPAYPASEAAGLSSDSAYGLLMVVIRACIEFPPR